MIELILPWPPTVNTYYTIARGRKILSKRGRAYKVAVSQIVLLQGANRLLSGRLKLHLTAFPPDRRRRDLSNIIKSLEDALVGAGVIEDDELIDDLHIVRREIEKPGRVLVRISHA